MLSLIEDPSPVVEDSVAWMLGALDRRSRLRAALGGRRCGLIVCLVDAGTICELFPDIILRPDVLPHVLSALAIGLDKEPRVAVNVCHAFTFLAESAFTAAYDALGPEDMEVASYPLSPQFEAMVEKLLMVSQR
jgi:importin subunit beta-1